MWFILASNISQSCRLQMDVGVTTAPLSKVVKSIHVLKVR